MTKLAEIRDALPETAKVLTQTVLDNPLPCAVVASGAVLAPRVALRLVRPRTPLEALALCVLLQVGLTYAGAKLMGPGGLLELKLRDEHGCLHALGDISDDEGFVPVRLCQWRTGAGRICGLYADGHEHHGGNVVYPEKGGSRADRADSPA